MVHDHEVHGTYKDNGKLLIIFTKLRQKNLLALGQHFDFPLMWKAFARIPARNNTYSVFSRGTFRAMGAKAEYSRTLSDRSHPREREMWFVLMDA
jgi:hypothetical protein